jgi:hypothetical protein
MGRRLASHPIAVRKHSSSAYGKWPERPCSERYGVMPHSLRPAARPVLIRHRPAATPQPHSKSRVIPAPRCRTSAPLALLAQLADAVAAGERGGSAARPSRAVALMDHSRWERMIVPGQNCRVNFPNFVTAPLPTRGKLLAPLERTLRAIADLLHDLVRVDRAQSSFL